MRMLKNLQLLISKPTSAQQLEKIIKPKSIQPWNRGTTLKLISTDIPIYKQMNQNFTSDPTK